MTARQGRQVKGQANIVQVGKKSPGKKVLGIIVLIGLIALIPILIILIKRTFFPETEAERNVTPENVRVVDVSSNSFTVTWTTKDKVVGHIKYGTSSGSLTQSASDDRESSGQYNSHYVVARDLSPETQYYFEIVSGDQTFQNNGAPYEVQTFVVTALPSTLDSLRGVVKDSSGSSKADSLVYLTLVGKGENREAVSQTLGTVTNDSGTWVINLSIRDKAGSSYISNMDDYYAKVETVASGASGSKVADISDNFGAVALGQNADDMAVSETVVAQSEDNGDEGNAGTLDGGGDGGSGGGTGMETFIEEVFFSNISDGAFTTVWETSETADCYIKYGIGSESLQYTAYDDRGEGREMYTHSVTIVDTANGGGTEYKFKIVCDGDEYDDNGSLYSFVKPLKSGVPKTDPVFGTIASSSGELDDAVILAQVSVDGVETTYISAVPDSSGNWTLELGYTRGISSDGTYTDYVDYDSDATVVLNVKGTKAATLLSTTVAELKEGTYLAEVALLEKLESTVQCLPLQISENARVSAGGSITGCGIKPGSTVTIELDGEDSTSDTTNATSQGSWTWKIPSGTDTGWYTLGVSLTTKGGQVQEIERRIYIQGTSAPQTAVNTKTGLILGSALMFILGGWAAINLIGENWERKTLDKFEKA